MGKSKDSIENAIIIRNIRKSFKLPHESHSGVKQAIINLFRKNRKKGYEIQEVLKDISFDIKKGEFFGVVGRNGSGKSTLLKLLGEIYTPDSGEIIIDGSLIPFIELGVGFNPELSGRENVYLNGALLGFSRKQVEDMYEDIVDFAELKRFMDQKLKNYSSGMQVRLAFSIAIRAKSDILLLDEVLAVGDEAFQQKCFEYFGDLKKNKKTVILVTHDMSAVEKFCDRAVLIDTGEVKKVGTSIEIAQLYRELFTDSIAESIERDNNRSKQKQKKDNWDSRIKSVDLSIYQDQKKVNTVRSGSGYELSLKINLNSDIQLAACGVNVTNSQNTLVHAFGAGGTGEAPVSLNKGDNTVTLRIEQNLLTNDTYYVDVALAEVDSSKNQKLIYQDYHLVKFSIRGVIKRKQALVHPRYEISIN